MSFLSQSDAFARMVTIKRYATVAQLVEQLIRNQQVAGSSPASSSMIADEKAARQKNHEKRTVFHGFLLFMRQKRVFMKSEVKIIF